MEMTQPAEAQLASIIRKRIDEIYAGGSVLGDDDRRYEIGTTSVKRWRGSFVADLVRSERPRATLEIGMAWGVSTLFILQALLENGAEFRPHVVMDPFQSTNYHDAARRSLRELGVADLVEFYGEPSEFALPRLAQEGRRFDLVFIDGSHRFEAVFTDLRFVNMLLKPGGLVIVDDTSWDSVHLACRFVETNFEYAVVAEGRPTADPGQGPARKEPRPHICAYRKPLESYHGELLFVPFFGDFAGTPLVEMMMKMPSRYLRHEGHMALRAGNLAEARLYFKVALCGSPPHFKTWLRLLRTYLPARLARALSGSRRGAGTGSALT
jgi:predicted O-methyltransferase YrrM